MDNFIKIETYIKDCLNKQELYELNKELNSIPKKQENAELHFKIVMLIYRNDIDGVIDEYLAKVMYSQVDYNFYKNCYELAKNYKGKNIN